MEITQKEQDAWHAGIDAGREIERQNATASAEPIHQYRVRYCSDWYDGLPDASDGKDYETRTLYASPVAQEHATKACNPSLQPVATAFFTEKGEVAYTGLFDRTLKALEAVKTTRMGISAGSIDLYAAPVAAQAQPPVSVVDGLPVGYIVHGKNTYLFVRGSDRPHLTHINGHDPVVCVTPVFSAQPQPSGNAGELPPMPGPGMTSFDYGSAIHWFTETQMQAYARAALADQASAQDREDAERYRWIRDEAGLMVLPYDDHGMGPEFPGGSDLDKAIDAARAAVKEQSS